MPLSAPRDSNCVERRVKRLSQGEVGWGGVGGPGPPSIFSVSSHAVSLGTPSSRGARPKGTLPAKVQKRHVSYSHVAQNIAAHVLLILRRGRSWAGWEVQAQTPATERVGPYSELPGGLLFPPRAQASRGGLPSALPAPGAGLFYVTYWA